MQRHIECDVAVVGGGAAGIAAAIGASSESDDFICLTIEQEVNQ